MKDPVTPTSPGQRVQALLLGVVLVAAAWVATLAHHPPAPLPADAPPGTFSAMRALTHLRTIAQTAHPLGSPQNAAVRRYLDGQLSGLGLKVEVQPFAWRWPEPNGCNLMARIPGAHGTNAPARAVALVCHYDSVPAGPGAGDDGAAVAALLETARALRSGAVVHNDVLLLFTDGEEVPGALPGSEAFVKSCSWMKDIGCVFNFDARGVSGPVMMYETGLGNGPIIRGWARASSRPVANSLMSEVYRHMPNDTDFTHFRKAGVPGLNFAFIGEARHYHQRTDDVEHLSLSTLQHVGEQALSLARHFGNRELSGLQGTDAVYFDVLGRALIYYPASWAAPLALVAAALFLGMVWRELRRGAVSAWKLPVAGLLWGGNLLLVAVLSGYGPEWLARCSTGASRWLGQAPLWAYWFLVLGITVAVSTAVQFGLRRWLGRVNLALGALVWWLLVALFSAFWMPGGSFLGLWPLLFGLLSVWLAAGESQGLWRQHLWLAVTALPTILLLAPLMAESFVALGPQAVAIPMVALAMLVGALSLQTEAVSRAWKWTLPVTGLVMVVTAAVIASL